VADGSEKQRKRAMPSWLVIALFGIPFALFVAFLLSRGSTPRSVEARFAERPDLAETAVAFREAYPEEYAAFLARIAAIADSEGQAVADRTAIGDIREFLAARSGAVSNAPVADLHALGGAIADLAEELQRANPQLCAQFVTQGVPDPARMPESATRAVGRMNALMFRAARAGEGVEQSRGGLTREDVAAWLAGMERLDPELPDRPPPTDAAQQCRSGVTAYRAAADLPEAQAANVAAHLIRLSFAPPATAP
jgi:hypothetical protein